MDDVVGHIVELIGGGLGYTLHLRVYGNRELDASGRYEQDVRPDAFG